MTKEKKHQSPIVKHTDLFDVTKKDLQEDILKAISSAKTKQNNLNKVYQRIACSLIVHVEKHGDVRVISNFIDTLSDSLHIKSMQKFFENYSRASYITRENKETGKKEIALVYDKKKTTKLGEALENPWWKAKGRSEVKPVNAIEGFDSFITRLEKRKDKDIEEDVIPSDLLQALRDVRDKYARENGEVTTQQAA
jgi:hypothetical protein